ncbi:amidase domain-containing protein [Mechercharimyces sp. CAU 1602]|uniref:amidase domain-containing protein n=1 Tax=Mechercharimyces sp. CAU 1602 TaxID=2973933 RepID=UPI0021612BE4|nr:amidase domain-containing protein [Mechercharimyces sp. CAU 1602]MCS1351711.1 amidase domain-containing protein [Mechercharimyces sp. CAU 1602]
MKVGIGSARYNRWAAKQYAEKWWNGYNPRYQKFEVDCTNFVSQCMRAGGIRLDERGSRSQGWWYRGQGTSSDQWSFSWAVAHSLRYYLLSGGVMKAKRVETAMQLQIGDIICYDWEGDGKWNHNTIVTTHDGAGMPLVNAHTINSYHRYWAYRDSHAWTPQTKIEFYQIQA